MKKPLTSIRQKRFATHKGRNGDYCSSQFPSTQKLAQQFWLALDTPVSLSCYMQDKYGEYSDMVSKKVIPANYQDPLSYYLDAQAVSFLKKTECVPTGIDREKVAFERFDEAEIMCYQTNNRFRTALEGNPQMNRIIFNMASKISAILGELPTFQQMDFRFGPGANFGVRGDTSAYKKLNSVLECNHEFSPVLQEFLEEFPGWIPEGIHEVVLRPGSELTTVNKNAMTDRCICIEPLLSGLCQKGYGNHIKNRLMRFGIDLSDQTINQRLAKRARLEDLVTVDFRMASDTIAYLLVMDLLPFNWFEALDRARSSRYLKNGVWKTFQKFSSMGNAYTFELESLIFYSMAEAVCKELGIHTIAGENVAVFGDDVIIPKAAFNLFSEVSSYCGFAINRDKSFTEGSFFESCGADYFDDFDVRPFHFNKVIETQLDLFYAYNNTLHTMRKIEDLSRGIVDHPNRYLRASTNIRASNAIRRLSKFNCNILRSIPPQLMAMGPSGYGDGHVISDDYVPIQPENGWDGHYFMTYVARPVKVDLPRFTADDDHIVDKSVSNYAMYISMYSSGTASCLADFVRLPKKALALGKSYTLRRTSGLRKIRVFAPTGGGTNSRNIYEGRVS